MSPPFVRTRDKAIFAQSRHLQGHTPVVRTPGQVWLGRGPPDHQSVDLSEFPQKENRAGGALARSRPLNRSLGSVRLDHTVIRSPRPGGRSPSPEYGALPCDTVSHPVRGDRLAHCPHTLTLLGYSRHMLSPGSSRRAAHRHDRLPHGPPCHTASPFPSPLHTIALCHTATRVLTNTRSHTIPRRAQTRRHGLSLCRFPAGPPALLTDFSL